MDKNIKLTKEKLLSFSLYLLVLSSLLKCFVPTFVTKIIPVISIIVAIITLYKSKISIKKNTAYFLAFYMFFLVGIIISGLYKKASGNALSLFFCICLLICQNSRTMKLNKCLIILEIGCFIFSLFTILELFNSELILQINSKFYSSEVINNHRLWLKYNLYSGIFPERAPCAFYSSVLIGIAFPHLITSNLLKEKKYNKFILYIVELIVGFWSILLTAKRGLLLATVMAMLIIYCINKKRCQKPFLQILISLSLIIIIAFFVFINLSSAQTVILRFVDNKDLLSGRENIYASMIELYKYSPILGIGTSNVDYLLGIGGHNIYLNVLCENGVFGLFFFLIAIFKTLQSSIKKGCDSTIDINTAYLYLVGLFLQFYFIIYGMSGNPLYDNYILYLYFFGVIICNMSENISKKKGI